MPTGGAQPTSHWRRHARRAIDAALKAYDEQPTELDAEADRKARIAAIDAAYPFTERRYWPYKMWLLERRRAIALMTSTATRPIDRQCPACGAAALRSCRDIESRAIMETFHEARVRGLSPTSNGPLFGED